MDKIMNDWLLLLIAASMISIKPFLLSAAGAAHRRNLLSASAMSMSAQSCGGGKSAVVFLHGLGDTPAGWSSLEYQLPSLRKSLKDVRYVFPPAPTIGLTINGGMQMPGWFDLFDWPIGVDARDDREGKMAAAEQIERTVEKLEKAEGIHPSRVIVGGFSQGAAVALIAAYHRRKEGKVPFAGCVCLSGWLTLKDELTVTEVVAKSTPLFWGHGQWDDKVLFEQQAEGVEKLRNLGVDVTDFSYPMGHSSHPQETEAMAEFVEKRLFPSE